jgi:hypothetical protein
LPYLITLLPKIKILKVSRPTLALLPISTVKIGKRYKYRHSDVINFLEENSIPGSYKMIAAKQKIKKRIHTRNIINKHIELMKLEG